MVAHVRQVVESKITGQWKPRNSKYRINQGLPVDELVLEPKGAGGTVETYLITALLEPKPNWLANVVVAIQGQRKYQVRPCQFEN